jgi:hypothetical protein
MHDRRHQQPHRLGEVDERTQVWMAQDHLGVAQVSADEGHIGRACEQFAAQQRHGWIRHRHRPTSAGSCAHGHLATPQ